MLNEANSYLTIKERLSILEGKCKNGGTIDDIEEYQRLSKQLQYIEKEVQENRRSVNYGNYKNKI